MNLGPQQWRSENTSLKKKKKKKQEQIMKKYMKKSKSMEM